MAVMRLASNVHVFFAAVLSPYQGYGSESGTIMRQAKYLLKCLHLLNQQVTFLHIPRTCLIRVAIIFVIFQGLSYFGFAKSVLIKQANAVSTNFFGLSMC